MALLLNALSDRLFSSASSLCLSLPDREKNWHSLFSLRSTSTDSVSFHGIKRTAKSWVVRRLIGVRERRKRRVGIKITLLLFTFYFLLYFSVNLQQI